MKIIITALLAIISVTSAFSQYSIGVDLVSITQRQSNTIMGMPAQIVTPGAGLFVPSQTAESLLYRVAFSRQSFSRPAYGGNFVDFGNHNYYKIAAGVGKQWSAESTISPHLGADLYYATTSADGTQGGGFVPSSFSYEGSRTAVGLDIYLGASMALFSRLSLRVEVSAAIDYSSYEDHIVATAPTSMPSNRSGSELSLLLNTLSRLSIVYSL